MEIINNQENPVQVGNDIACYVGCAASCYITGGVGTAFMIALLAL